MMTRSNLSSSEWVAALKLNINYANVAGVPGVNTEHRSAPSIRCRRCGNETETIPHRLRPSLYTAPSLGLSMN